MQDLALPAWAPQPDSQTVTIYNATGNALTDLEVEIIATSIVTKDIWGPTFRAFMGMSDAGSGVDEITDDPVAWGRARIAEPYVFRALDVRAKAIASVPLRCWRIDRNGRKTAVPHMAIDILNRTNPYTAYVNGLGTLMRYTLGSLDTHGRCCWQMAFSQADSRGRRIPTEIYWLVPSAFSPVRGVDRNLNVPFAGVNYMTGGRQQFLSEDKVVYFSTDNGNDPVSGTSKVSVLKNTINLRLYSVKSNYDFFRNSMRPDWILSGEWKNNEENVERIKRSLARHYTGESNRSPLVVGENTKATLLTTTAKDAEWVQMMRMVGEEIMAVFGVPVIFLNNFERATYENAKQARLMLWHETMIQETRDLAAQMTSKYLWRWWPESIGQGLELGFDYGAVEGLTEDVGLLWERVNNFHEKLQKQVEGGLLTANQARKVMVQVVEMMGLDATPWKTDLPTGDIRFVPFNVIPSDQSSVQALMNAEASRSANPLTAFLIENVPGAPNAGDNARKGDSVLDSRNLRDQQATARASQQSTSFEADLVEIKALLGRGATKALPNPILVRDARLASIQKRLIAKLKVFFQAQQRDALRAFRKLAAKAAEQKADTPDADLLWDHEAAKAELRAIISAAGGEAAEQAFQAATDEFGLSGVVWSNDMPWLSDYMGGRLSLIDGIDDTTTDALRQTLLDGSQRGDSIPQLADRMAEIFSQAIDYRAERIARTETIQAYGNASLEAYRRAGIEKARMYDGPNADSADCINVDGQVVTLGEAQALMDLEHVNGTRGVAPYIDTFDSVIQPQAAAILAPRYDNFGIAVA